jgi:PBSX family phage terminase large subunit
MQEPDLQQVLRIMSPAQIKSIAHSPRSKIALWEGSVSAGKTIASLFALLIAIAKAPQNGIIVIVGKTLQTVYQNVFVNLQSKELFGAVAGQVQYTRGATAARILGREVMVTGANDAKAEGRIRGATCSLIYVDEATILPSLEYFHMLVTRLRVPGARLLATTNPGARNHWLRVEYMLRAAEVGMGIFSFRMRDNPTLEASYVASMERTFTGVFYKRFILGEWTNAAGAIFDMWDPDQHVKPWAELPRMHRLIGVGMDYGTSNASAALMLGLGEDRKLYLVDEWRHDPKKAPHLRLTDLQQSRMVREWLRRPHLPYDTTLQPEWFIVDPAAAHFRAQLFNDGLSTQAGDNEVAAGIRTMSSLLGSGQFLSTTRCPGFNDEMPGYVWDEKATEKGVDAPVKVDDHSLDGGRYVVHTTRETWRTELLLPIAA